MVSRAIASIAALLLRHLAPEMYSAAGYTLPNYHPYQVARHLAAEISAEAALRVVRAWRAFNTRLPFRLRFPSIRFRFDSERAPTRFRFDSGATPIRFDLIRMRLRRGPASTPIRFRFVSDSIPIRFRFDSDSIPIRFRFDFDSESIPIRSESDCLPPPFPPRRQRLQLSRARATGCSRTSRLRRRR